MSKTKQILTSWRVIVLLIFVALSIWTIQPNFNGEGVLIKDVEFNTSADINGVVSGEIINKLNDVNIIDVNSYNSIVTDISPGDLVKLQTNKDSYSFVAGGNQTTELGIRVDKIPSSSLRAGLDIIGGARVLLKPEGEITNQQMSDVLEITKNRLNAYGLKDVKVKEVSGQYISVEIAGSSEEEVVDLIGQQGKFEAKIANETVFVGGTDIKQVCRSADCSGVRTCNQVGTDQWSCQFMFSVTVSPESAKKHQDITSELSIITENGNQYLSEKLDLYLDNELVDSLYISSGLRGIEATTFTIQGPGIGSTEGDALNDAITNMNTQQTLLITGSLPVKLDIAEKSIISPLLGQEFLKSAIITFITAILAVGAVVFVRYRKLKIAIPIMLTSVFEILIILGVSARWISLDLAAIAAILASIGTGVDHQIVITDETLSKKSEAFGWKEKLKRAFFIITATYLTIVVAMIPLIMMGGQLLRGFAIVTIIGASIGVFITRPAYAKIIEILFNK